MQYRIAGKHEIDERMGGDGYAQTMVELIAQDSSVVHIDCDLAGCSKASEIAKVYPAQVINAGIAEANAVGIAAGLSAAGKIPFVHSFGPFISRRAFDQAFLSAAYAKLKTILPLLTGAARYALTKLLGRKKGRSYGAFRGAVDFWNGKMGRMEG